MKKRLFLYTMSIVLAGVVVFSALAVYILFENNLDISRALFAKLFLSAALVLCGVFLLCFLLVKRVSEQILKPFAFVEEALDAIVDGEYKPAHASSEFDEINEIVHKIDSVVLVLKKNIDENKENARRREEFFSNASHELKTPLTAIKGFNELTELNNKNEDLDKYIAGISRETDRMLSLIGDMLKLSELENSANSGQIMLSDDAIVSLAAIVADVQDTLSTAISQKYIKLNVVGDTDVHAEHTHIYELVKNIIENAVRYNKPGGRITVTIEKNAISVSDSGIGIPDDEQMKIFERFYRVEKSRSVKGGGTGLGLSIVKHICAIYNWKLSLKSKPGEGTEIIVTFS